jgi:hypothetical protein
VAPTVWFITPDNPRPTGGIRTIYRFVDDLVVSGINASVVHEHRPFRCRWFPNTTPVTWLDELVLQPGDLLAVPEILVPRVAEQLPDTPMVILNQGPYLTFQRAGIPPAPPPVVLPSSTVGIVTGSQDGVEYLELAFPDAPIERIHYPIDTRPFGDPTAGKERAIAFMPRRRGEDLVQVLRILERRGALNGWRLYPINGLIEEARLDVLRRSAVFLSFNEREGFGLPPVEAMAAGCVVIGYAGGGGREYMRPEICFPVGEGAIPEYVLRVEDVIRGWNDGTHFTDLRRRAADFVSTEYSDEAGHRPSHLDLPGPPRSIAKGSRRRLTGSRRVTGSDRHRSGPGGSSPGRRGCRTPTRCTSPSPGGPSPG